MRLNDKINNYDILWKLKKTAQRKQESTFVIKDKNGNDIKEPDEIKDKVSEHYDNLYTNNEIQEGYREYNEDLEKLIEQCWKMEDELGEELSLSEELVRQIIKDLEKHKTPGPDNLTNEMIAEGGNSVKNSVVRMMKIIYRTEELPKDWNTAFIKNIYKGKGSKKEMGNYRGLILNSHIAKIFEKILAVKENITLQDMSEYQCGARKGKSIREHHFTIRNIIEEAKSGKEEITAVYFDIKKCFDKMVLKEAMKEMWMKGTKIKHWRLMYELNSDNTLIPVTDLGECKKIEVKEIIKQGSVLGSGISALTIDSLTRIIEEHGKVWEIGGIKINPLLFQDDIFAVNKTEDIQETISIIETFQNLKRLQFHEEKTKKSIINGKKDKTVYINGIEIERTKSHKYLGKIIEENGKIKEEIKERIKIAKMQVNQAFQVIDKNELSRKRIEVGIKLLQAVIMPTLIFGAETWNKLTEKEKTEINNVQTTFLSRLLRVPKTTPKCALIHETNSTKVEHLANQRKLEYYIDLHNREETHLEVRIRKYQEETNMSYEKEIEELKKL